MIEWRSYITFQELSRAKILISRNARILKFCLAFKILALFACDLNIYTGPTLKLGQGLLIVFLCSICSLALSLVVLTYSLSIHRCF